MASALARAERVYARHPTRIPRANRHCEPRDGRESRRRDDLRHTRPLRRALHSLIRCAGRFRRRKLSHQQEFPEAPAIHVVGRPCRAHREEDLGWFPASRRSRPPARSMSRTRCRPQSDALSESDPEDCGPARQGPPRAGSRRHPSYSKRRGSHQVTSAQQQTESQGVGPAVGLPAGASPQPQQSKPKTPKLASFLAAPPATDPQPQSPATEPPTCSSGSIRTSTPRSPTRNQRFTVIS